MRNIIEYFYNLKPDEIRKNKDEYLFEIGDRHYLFKECNRRLEEVQELYNLINELYYKKIYLHQIILNNNREIITMVDNKMYILMNMFVLDNERITLNDLLYLNKIKIDGNYKYILRNNWRKLWMDKIDYIEYQMNENKQKFKMFNSSIDFVIGMAENGIQLLDGIEINNLSLSHNRINGNTRIKELYDPLNIIIDSSVRDVSEYIKDTLINALDYLEQIKKNSVESYLFFVRLLFFTNYFDVFDSFLKGENAEYESKINMLLIKIKDYEILIKKVYSILYQYQLLPEIEWIKKQAF